MGYCEWVLWYLVVASWYLVVVSWYLVVASWYVVMWLFYFIPAVQVFWNVGCSRDRGCPSEHDPPRHGTCMFYMCFLWSPQVCACTFHSCSDITSAPPSAPPLAPPPAPPTAPTPFCPSFRYLWDTAMTVCTLWWPHSTPLILCARALMKRHLKVWYRCFFLLLLFIIVLFFPIFVTGSKAYLTVAADLVLRGIAEPVRFVR